MMDVCLRVDLGVLRISGADARTFLQGQLSNDLKRLEATRALFAGLHTPQGRTLALLRLFPAADDPQAVLAALPTELLAETTAQLRRYVLRSKVQITDDGAASRVWGVRHADGALGTAVRAAGATFDGHPLDLGSWHALEVAAGLPEVYAATRGEFVAQMLNLDCIDGIAWDKGCYTGQEIIARAHYRGQVKRRMRRFAAGAIAPPPPGSAHRTSDGLEVRVVRSARTSEGQCELLGIAPLSATSADERPLPYAWPDASDDDAME